MLLDKPLGTLTEADIQALIDDPYPEGKDIDYKDRINLDLPAAKDEYRRDITSFANSIGGHLIFGVEDTKGKPTKIVGLKVDNEEREMQTI